MKQAELDAAVKSARESVSRMMTAAGYGHYIATIESKVDYVEVVQLALQAAEDERARIAKERS
jgi:hypothetical protein